VEEDAASVYRCTKSKQSRYAVTGDAVSRDAASGYAVSYGTQAPVS
jgi:hypothetical protein